jgi:WD repeat-containing protein 19
VRAREPEMWEQLAHAAMSSLEIEFAIRVYRIVGDASMVLSLERLRNVEDVHELAANVLMLFEKPECYDMAERLFIKSNKPNEALQMRVDLKHWDAAAALARKYDAKKLDEIKREHASACETRGDVEMALTLFEESLTAADQSRGGINNAKAGVARCSFRLGDVETGLRIVGQLNDKNTYGECAFLCEQFGDANAAAALFEKAGLFENAVSIYLDAKQYDLAKPLLARIPTGSGSSSCRALRVSYANAMEFSGNFEEAANEYELARVWEHAVRIRLTLLKPCDTEKAFAICRQSRSQEAASVAAGYCRQVGDVDRAVEFLLLARKSDDAFALAGESGPSAMDKLCRLVSNDATATAREYRKLATYFETSLSWRKAGDAHAQCGNNEHAVRCYLKETSDDSVGAAIALVGSLRDDGLTSVVVEFLSSATGASLSVGDPSNKNNTSSQHTAWLFKLYVALGDYDAASTTSALLARQEQEMGNYKVAHAALFESSRELLRDGKTETRLAIGVQKQLNLLHSYVLVKSFVRQQDHEGCARLLHRIAKNITKFPAHVVPILTSTVVECTRGGMKRTAVHFAQKLMAPTLRAEIGDAYKRKVETIARKPDPNAEDTTEPVSACPFCDTTGGAYDLTCNTCQADVPMCVASGRRVVAEEWAHCPSCAFPCNKAAFVKTVDAEGGECPLCRARVDASAVVAGSGGGGTRRSPGGA